MQLARFLEMRSVMLVAWVLVGLSAAGLCEAQVVSSRVSTTAPGTAFLVDDIEYRQAQTFLWQAGSKHKLEAVLGQTDPTATTRYSFTSWANASGTFTANSPIVTITANPTVTDYIATIGIAYRIDLFLFNIAPDPTRPVVCSYPGNSNQPTVNNPGIQFPGVVYVSGVCYDSSQRLYVAANSTVSLSAYPYPGFIFQGWTLNNGISNDFINSFVLTGPTVLAPRFAPAKQVTFLTDPPELQLLVDRQAIPTSLPGSSYNSRPPGIMDFGEGQSIVLGAASPQMDAKGQVWVFDSFDIGGGQNTVYKVTDVNIPTKIVGRFKRGVSVSFLTNPTNLKLNVDGRDSWPSYNFTWAVDSKHTIIAPPETTDTKGRKYRFTGWNHGGDAQQNLTVPSETPASGGIRWIANYQLIPRLTVTTAKLASGCRWMVPIVVLRAS